MPRIRVISRVGNPFVSGETGRAVPPEHLEILNSLFFEGEVDKGGTVEIDGQRYVCTSYGWACEE
jgi:hypothetical protein